MMSGPDVQPLPRRTRVLAVLIAAPVLITALGVLSLDLGRRERPASPLFTKPAAYSLADGIAANDVEGAYRFIRAGQDPNELIAVRDSALTAGRSVFVSPLLWAVATQNKDAVLMLLGYGARMDRPSDKAAACLADSLGNADIATLLRTRHEAIAREQCPEARATDAPLLSFVETEESVDRVTPAVSRSSGWKPQDKSSTIPAR